MSDKKDRVGEKGVVQKVRQVLSSWFVGDHAAAYILGLALFYAWNLTDVYGRPLSALMASSSSLLSIMVGALCATLMFVASALVLTRLKRFFAIARILADIAGAFMLILAVASIVGIAHPLFATYAFRVVSRLCSAPVIVTWGIAYSRLDSHSITTYALAAFLVAAIASLVMSVVPVVVRDVLFALMLPLSTAVLHGAGLDGGADADNADNDVNVSDAAAHSPSPGRAFVSTVWRMILTFFLFGIVTWIVILGVRNDAGMTGNLGIIVPVGCIVIVGILLSLVLASGSTFSYSLVYRLVLPITLTGILIIVMLSSSSGVGPMLVSVGYTCFDLFCFIMIADTCNKTGVRAGLAFGWCRAIESSVPIFSIGIIALMTPDASGGAPLFTEGNVVSALGILTAVVLVISLVLDSREIMTHDHLDPSIDYPQAEAITFAIQCERAIALYKLTPREAEVLSLVVRGRSVPHIAERLSLSRSTVKTYIMRIYQKMGVAERQEMIDAIEAIPLDDADRDTYTYTR